MSSIYKDRIVNSVYDFCNLRCGTRCYFFNFLNCMLLITWVNSLWRISSKEIYIIFQTTYSLYNRKAFFFCYTRINSRFIYYDISF